MLTFLSIFSLASIDNTCPTSTSTAYGAGLLVLNILFCLDSNVVHYCRIGCEFEKTRTGLSESLDD